MPIFTFTINNHVDAEKILKELQTLTIKTNQIMATIQEISAKVDELQTKLDAEQEQIAAAIATLNQAVADLTTALADGGTAEERQAVIDKISSAITDLEATV